MKLLVKIYDWLFYWFYCGLLNKKNEEESHQRAITMTGIAIVNYFTLIIIIYFVFTNRALTVTKYYFFILILIVLNALVYFFEEKFYLKKGRNLLAIQRCNSVIPKRIRPLLGLFSIIFFLMPFALFIYFGVFYF
jgi:hypothetical protein